MVDISLLDGGRAKLRKALGELSPSDTLGSAGAAAGIVLVAVGIVQQEMGVGFGATIRTLGGVLFLGGLGAVLFGESRRRAAVIGGLRSLAGRVAASKGTWLRPLTGAGRTGWDWPELASD